jgi:hypothetical protein
MRISSTAIVQPIADRTSTMNARFPYPATSNDIQPVCHGTLRGDTSANSWRCRDPGHRNSLYFVRASTVAPLVPPGEADYVPDIRDTSEVTQESIESKTKASMRHTAVSSEVHVPLQGAV